MDIIPQGDAQQPISDDQELAKALAGVMPDVPEPVVQEPAAPTPAQPAPIMPTPTTSVAPTILQQTPSSGSAPMTPTDLDQIKMNALKELRPLIDKVQLPPEEMFDTYLMLIRSTDDSSLVRPAHIVAQGIADETRRAEALLEIIKEIDYLSRNNKTTAA
jgi:hypothetical protein